MNPYIFRHYRFGLGMEKTAAKGYISEKILNFFLGGSIPIYYGSEEVFDIFNKESFIFYDIHNPKLALNTVAYLEGNHSAYMEMRAQPILKDGKNTLRDFFSLNYSIGDGMLRQKILNLIQSLNVTADNSSYKKVPSIIHEYGGMNTSGVNISSYTNVPSIIR